MDEYVSIYHGLGPDRVAELNILLNNITYTADSLRGVAQLGAANASNVLFQMGFRDSTRQASSSYLDDYDAFDTLTEQISPSTAARAAIEYRLKFFAPIHVVGDDRQRCHTANVDYDERTHFLTIGIQYDFPFSSGKVYRRFTANMANVTDRERRAIWSLVQIQDWLTSGISDIKRKFQTHEPYHIGGVPASHLQDVIALSQHPRVGYGSSKLLHVPSEVMQQMVFPHLHEQEPPKLFDHLMHRRGAVSQEDPQLLHNDDVPPYLYDEDDDDDEPFTILHLDQQRSSNMREFKNLWES